MEKYIIDNGDGGDFSRAITWQYDNAKNIKGIILDLFKGFYDNCVPAFWNNWLTAFLSINTSDTLGLSYWGNLLGVKRISGISDALFRRLIKAKVILLDSCGAIDDFNKYCESIFGSFNGVSVTDNLDMTIIYVRDPEGFVADGDVSAGEFTLLWDNPEVWQLFPAGVRDGSKPGVVFGLAGQEGGFNGYATGNIENSNFFG